MSNHRQVTVNSEACQESEHYMGRTALDYIANNSLFKKRMQKLTSGVFPGSFIAIDVCSAANRSNKRKVSN